jgi:hypothetical membrane protein
MSDASLARLGILANAVFWPLMFAMASLRPGYSHLHQAISELGSYGAPRMWVWNVFGYIAPGLMLAVFGWSFGRRLRPRSPWAAGLMALAGLGLAISGVLPADMDDRQGRATMLHEAGAMLSLLGWMLGMIAVAIAARRGRPDITGACVVALAASVGGFALYALLPSMPALVQRINFGVFFGWYLVIALLLLTVRRPLTS